MDIQRLREIHKEGTAAAVAGKERGDCPYKLTAAARQAWMRGFELEVAAGQAIEREATHY